MEKDEIDDRTVSTGASRARRVLDSHNFLMFVDMREKFPMVLVKTTVNIEWSPAQAQVASEEAETADDILSADGDTGSETRTNMHFRECNTVPPK
eukprot:6214772-Pleurochrysis_carterae.AAC.6